LFFKIFYGTIVLVQTKSQVVLEKKLSGQETWQEPKSFIVCDHDVKIYSQIKERKSSSLGYQDNQMFNKQVKSFKISDL